MPRFKVGDTVKNPQTGSVFEITDVDIGRNMYTLKAKYPLSYWLVFPIFDIDREFEHISTLDVMPTLECQHEWAEYEGIMNKFKYCIHCDKKEAL